MEATDSSNNPTARIHTIKSQVTLVRKYNVSAELLPPSSGKKKGVVFYPKRCGQILALKQW
jgi:hypothetical protein